MLITAQANLNVQDINGHTCLDYAAQFGRTELFDLLRCSGAQSGIPEDEREEEALEETADGKSGMFGTSSTKIGSLLQSAGGNDLKRIVEGEERERPNLNSRDFRGRTCLMNSCADGCKEIVLSLLTKTTEVHVNAVDDTWKSALHHACRRPKSSSWNTVNVEIVSALIEAGANKDCRDNDHCTPLMFACANGDQRVVEMLITAQANLNVQDTNGHTCLDYATHCGRIELFDLLMRSGAQ